MATLDPQVQVKLIDIAWSFAKEVDKDTGRYSRKTELEIFKETYAELVKTVSVQ